MRCISYGVWATLFQHVSDEDVIMALTRLRRERENLLINGLLCSTRLAVYSHET